MIVVDDRSEDRTADVAREHGARVIDGAELPTGWVGKPWALQQGLIAAQSEIVVFLDADVQPSPELPTAVASLLAPGRRCRSGIGPAGVLRAGHRPAAAAASRAASDAHLPARSARHHGPASGRDRRNQRTVLCRPPRGAAGRRRVCADRRDRDRRCGAGPRTRPGWMACGRRRCQPPWARGDVSLSAREALREWAGRSLALPGAASRSRQAVDLALVWAVQGPPGGAALARAAGCRPCPHAAGGLRTLGPLTLLQLAVRLALQVALARSIAARWRAARARPVGARRAAHRSDRGGSAHARHRRARASLARARAPRSLGVVAGGRSSTAQEQQPDERHEEARPADLHERGSPCLASGTPKIARRAPSAARPATASAMKAARSSTPGMGRSTSAPPPKVITDFPPGRTSGTA